MKTNQFAVRRRIAKTSFAAILITLFSCLAIAAWGDDGSSARLREAGLIIAPICLFLTGLIGQYAHLVYKTDENTSLTNSGKS